MNPARTCPSRCSSQRGHTGAGSLLRASAAGAAFSSARYWGDPGVVRGPSTGPNCRAAVVEESRSAPAEWRDGCLDAGGDAKLVSRPSPDGVRLKTGPNFFSSPVVTPATHGRAVGSGPATVPRLRSSRLRDAKPEPAANVICFSV